MAELDAEKHAGLVKSVAKDISDYQAPDMPSLVEFVRDTSARLGVIMTDEAAVLSQFPTWPQVRLKLSCAKGVGVPPQQFLMCNPCETVDWSFPTLLSTILSFFSFFFVPGGTVYLQEKCPPGLDQDLSSRATHTGLTCLRVRS